MTRIGIPQTGICLPQLLYSYRDTRHTHSSQSQILYGRITMTQRVYDNLSTKRQRFVDEYLVDYVGAHAATRAGYSERSAQTTASRLLSDDKVTQAINERLADQRQRSEIRADNVLGEINKIALFDPRKLFDANGNPLPIEALDDDTAAAVAGLEVEAKADGSRVAKYKLASKLDALEKLMRHLGQYEKDNEQQGQLAQALSGAAKRVRKLDSGDGKG